MAEEENDDPAADGKHAARSQLRISSAFFLCTPLASCSKLRGRCLSIHMSLAPLAAAVAAAAVGREVGRKEVREEEEEEEEDEEDDDEADEDDLVVGR